VHMQITPKERLAITGSITVGAGGGGKTASTEQAESCDQLTHISFVAGLSNGRLSKGRLSKERLSKGGLHPLISS